MIEKSTCSKNLLIRSAQVKDAAEIILMVKQVFDEAPYFPRTAEEFDITIDKEEEYIENIALFLISEIEGKIVGSATLDRSALSKLNHTATFGITILKEYCGLGIGSLLTNKVIEWSEQNGVEKIDLEVFADNIPAIGLYKKFGFIEEGRKIKAIKSNEEYKDIILMSKFLKAGEIL